MINNFVEIIPNKLYRGSAPSPEDVKYLKDKFNIKKIISLDGASGNRISRSCKLLGISQIMLPIGIENTKKDLLHIFRKYNLKKLLLNDGPTFIHCFAGKDRTGLICALFECKYLGVDPEDAIKEAKLLGFGIGVDPKIINLFEKLIRSCKPEKSDVNDASIVENEREYIGDNRDSFLDEGRQGSFAPYLSPTRQHPVDALYSYIDDQSPTRENYQSENPFIDTSHKDVIPVVGLFNNESGARGFGPTENYSGFFYD
jgi:hypothetical protein